MPENGGTCQWVMTNLVPDDKPLDGPESIGICLRSAIVERAGRKIGFIGIGEKEWVTRFTNLECDLVY